MRVKQPATASSDLPWVLGLVLLGLLSRIPFASTILYHWDSINYTLALKDYNIALHQPQPPGYLLYVLLTRLVYAFVQSPNWTFVGINIVISILAAIVLYFFGKRMFNQAVGAAASLLLLLGPLFWFYSEIALPNVIDALVVTLDAWLLWEVARGKDRYIIPAAALLGIAGGFRQQTLAFMAPLAVLAFRRQPFSRMLVGASVTTVLFLASFVPMVALTGGLDQYRAAVASLSSGFFTRTSIFLGAGLAGLESNVGKWISFTLYSLLLAAAPLAAWPFLRRRAIPTALRDERTWFLLTWMLPSLAFYTFVHMGGHGLIFTYLPAVLLIAAKALYDLAAWFGQRRRTVFSAGLLAILLVNVLVFADLPAQPFPGRSFKIVNSDTIQRTDRFYTARFSLIQRSFDPATTILLADQWRHLQYYLPGYTALSTACGQPENLPVTSNIYVTGGGRYQEIPPEQLAARLPARITTVVLFDVPASCVLPGLPQGRLQSFPADGGDLVYFQLASGEALTYAHGQYGLRP